MARRQRVLRAAAFQRGKLPLDVGAPEDARAQSRCNRCQRSWPTCHGAAPVSGPAGAVIFPRTSTRAPRVVQYRHRIGCGAGRNGSSSMWYGIAHTHLRGSPGMTIDVHRSVTGIGGGAHRGCGGRTGSIAWMRCMHPVGRVRASTGGGRAGSGVRGASAAYTHPSEKARASRRWTRVFSVLDAHPTGKTRAFGVGHASFRSWTSDGKKTRASRRWTRIFRSWTRIRREKGARFSALDARLLSWTHPTGKDACFSALDARLSGVCSRPSVW